MTKKLQAEIVSNMVTALYGKLDNKEVQAVVSSSLNLSPLDTMRVWDVIRAESLMEALGAE